MSPPTAARNKTPSVPPEYDRRADNPEHHGFEFAGYVVRLPDGRYGKCWDSSVGCGRKAQRAGKGQRTGAGVALMPLA